MAATSFAAAGLVGCGQRTNDAAESTDDVPVSESAQDVSAQEAEPATADSEQGSVGRTVTLNNGIEMPRLGIGISNYYEEGFDRIVGMASIPPAVLQNETHPYFPERNMHEHLAASGVGTLLEAWFPLGGKDGCKTLFADETIAEISGNHGVSPAQTLIRWHLQTGNVCIPGSSNPDHIREDADVWDFELAADEMAAIDALDRGERLAWY